MQEVRAPVVHPAAFAATYPVWVRPAVADQLRDRFAAPVRGRLPDRHRPAGGKPHRESHGNRIQVKFPTNLGRIHIGRVDIDDKWSAIKDRNTLRLRHGHGK